MLGTEVVCVQGQSGYQHGIRTRFENRRGGLDKGGGLLFCKSLNYMLRVLISIGATMLSESKE